MKLLLAILIFSSSNARADWSDQHRRMQLSASQLERELQKTCGRSIRVDITDYLFFNDEEEAWDYPGLEYLQIVGRVLTETCEKHPESKKKISAIESLVFKRGSIGERKMIWTDGQLIHLSTRDPREAKKNKDDLVKEDLVRLLGIDFDRDFAKEQEAATKRARDDKEAADEKDRKETSDRKNAELKAKLDALNAWFQAETKKITAKPDAKTGEKMQKLSETYERKLNEIQNSY